MIAGVLADLTGDYRLGFTVLSLVSAAGCLAFIMATPPIHPRGGRQTFGSGREESPP